MQQRIWQQVVMAVVVGLMVVSSAGRTPAAVLNECCVCDLCDGSVLCVGVPAEACDPTCSEAAGQQNSTLCGSESFNNTCGGVAACAFAPVGAPAVGATGLTVVTLVLAGLGAAGLWRAAKRKREDA